MYRIISGEWKGKRVSAPKNFEVRPTTDFAKEALFSILEHRLEFSRISVLDLFAGIGSVTLEFASRYCKDITAVEIHPKHALFISSMVQDMDLGLSVRVQRSDVLEWIKNRKDTSKKFDLVFADPPFDFSVEQYFSLVEKILEGNLLREGGFFVLEHRSNNKIQHPFLRETRKYGNVSFSFF